MSDKVLEISLHQIINFYGEECLNDWPKTIGGRDPLLNPWRCYIDTVGAQPVVIFIKSKSQGQTEYDNQTIGSK